jgi:hypothetical protein
MTYHISGLGATNMLVSCLIMLMEDKMVMKKHIYCHRYIQTYHI